MSNKKDQLKLIAACFIEEHHDYFKLSSAIQSFKSIVNDHSTMDFNTPENVEDLAFTNGIAIGAKWAALCLDDIIRTKQFVRGIFQAIEDKRKSKTDKLHILYAGTGPFATLILPIVAFYNPEDIQITLMDVNKTSLDQARSLMNSLGFEDFIHSDICTDATNYKLEEDANYDIVISETMQHALLREQQVPIMLNLVKQLPKETIFIPSSIKLDVALFDSRANFSMKKNENRCLYLGEVVKFDRPYINLLNNNELKTEKLWSTLIALPDTISSDYDSIVMTTDIDVYEGISIGFNESSLTIPKTITQTSRIQDQYSTLECNYILSSLPYFEYVWIH